jgi:hypothetical protein
MHEKLSNAAQTNDNHDTDLELTKATTRTPDSSTSAIRNRGAAATTKDDDHRTSPNSSSRATSAVEDEYEEEDDQQDNNNSRAKSAEAMDVEDPAKDNKSSTTEDNNTNDGSGDRRESQDRTDTTISQNDGDAVMKDDDPVPTLGNSNSKGETDPSKSNGSTSNSNNNNIMMNNKSPKNETKKENVNTDDTKSKTEENGESGEAAANATAAAAAAPPPPPVMKGTLSFDLAPQKRHLIRGMWNYENSTAFPPQRFELVRNLGPDEDPTILPVDGEFSGSFSLAYVHITSRGKRKERSKVIPEQGVFIKFIKVEGKKEYIVEGKGTNQFGVFHINGTAIPTSMPDDPSFQIELRKRYEPGPVVVASTNDSTATNTAGDAPAETVAAEPLPEPSKTFTSGVVSLRGKLVKKETIDIGLSEVVHRITGLWAAGLNFLLDDPNNTRGISNRFEYEHKSSVPSKEFPVSGRYSGWFDLSNEDGSRTRINERDVYLRFRPNNAGYYNVEGKGSNVFGKYTITGTLNEENIITIFRHFQPRKIKKSTTAPAPVASIASSDAGATSTTDNASRRPSLVPTVEVKLKLEDVEIPNDDGSGEPMEPITVPTHGTYSAVSRGVLRVNDDSSHSCQGKWAVTRDHFTNGQTSSFNFRLEPHFAAEAIEELKKSSNWDSRIFPLDSALYKGSFQLKKQGSRYQTIIDQQVVMKFRKNTQGAYNVHGKGYNAIGEFNLLGTLIMSGKAGGQVELYRMYPPEKLAAAAVAPPPPVPSTSIITPVNSTALPPVPAARPFVNKVPSSIQQSGSLVRRESSRQIKVPSRLEEDDPDAQLTRTLDKCAQILKFMREKDVEMGAFFSEPVDAVALGIPTYHQIIKEPMDLRTIHRKMEASEIATPDEFARLVRLVFENAMKFNIDPAHSVHQAARNLLTIFNQKYRDVERILQSIRSTHGLDADFGTAKGKGKDGKKRKREEKSLKAIRLEEAQAMAAANASAIASLIAAAPTPSSSTVTRTEFNLLVSLIQQMQDQLVRTHTALAELSPGETEEEKKPSGPAPPPKATSSTTPKSVAPAPATKKPKKPVERKEPVVEEMVEDDSAPLTLEEQELLTETINDLPHEHLGGVIQIIREAAPVGADEDEIDLEIDQLDHKTQRKLLRHVMKVRAGILRSLFTVVDLITYVCFDHEQWISSPKRRENKRKDHQLRKLKSHPRRRSLNPHQNPSLQLHLLRFSRLEARMTVILIPTTTTMMMLRLPDHLVGRHSRKTREATSSSKTRSVECMTTTMMTTKILAPLPQIGISPNQTMTRRRKVMTMTKIGGLQLVNKLLLRKHVMPTVERVKKS